MPFDRSRIASLCTAAYAHNVPARGAKPTRRSNGVLEWTVLAGFVIEHQDQYSVVSIATGLKCTPYTQVAQARGDVVHDSHAEVLARRGARLWLLARLEAERAGGECGPRLFEHAHGRWRLGADVRLHLYVSTLPCGDASSLLFEFQRARQDVDANRTGAVSPRELLCKYTAAAPSAGGSSAVSRGRAAQAGARGQLRTKPGRPDSPPSISMSCSDKIALWAAVGVQGSLLSAVLEPVRISSVTVSDGAVAAIGCDGELHALLRDDCARSLNRAVPPHQHVVVGFTAVQFSDSRESVAARALGVEPASAPGSILYVAPLHKGGSALAVENLVAGTRLGASTKRTTALLKPAARSSVCKLAWWNRVSAAIPADATSYWHAKHSPATQPYRAQKQALRGDASDQAHLDAVAAFLANTHTSTTAPVVAMPAVPTPAVFSSWLATPAFIEQFQRDGGNA